MRRSSFAVTELFAFKDSLQNVNLRSSLTISSPASPNRLPIQVSQEQDYCYERPALSSTNWSSHSDRGVRVSGTQLYLAKRREQLLQRVSRSGRAFPIVTSRHLSSVRQFSRSTSKFQEEKQTTESPIGREAIDRASKDEDIVVQYVESWGKPRFNSKHDDPIPSRIMDMVERTGERTNSSRAYRGQCWSTNVLPDLGNEVSVNNDAPGSFLVTEHDFDSNDDNNDIAIWPSPNGFFTPTTDTTTSDILFERNTTSTDSALATWLTKLPLSEQTFEEFVKKWRSLRPRRAKVVWRTCMATLISHDITSAVQFLRVTMDDDSPPVGDIRKAVQMLVERINLEPDDYPPRLVDDLCSVIISAHDKYAGAVLSQLSILFVIRGRPDFVMSWYERLKASDVAVFHNTLLHFAHALARAGQADGAFDALQGVAATGYSVSDLPFLKACSLLLRASKGRAGNYEANTEFIAKLFKMGVTFNTVHYNVLILNAVEEDDAGTAWLLYKMIYDNGLKPDDYTFTHLMFMCRRRRDRMAYRSINYDSWPTRREIHPHLLLELLISRRLFYTSPTRPSQIRLTFREPLTKRHRFRIDQKFDRALRFYERHCELEPLRNLGIVPPGHQSRWIGSKACLSMPRPPPTPEVLAFMIKAFVDAQPRPVKTAHLLYQQFRLLRDQGDPFIVPLAATSGAYNYFLKFLTKTSRTVDSWPAILRDMVQPLPRKFLNPHTSRPYKPCRPDAYTWNIIVNSLARAGKFQAAEAIMANMTKHKMTPNLVTWNSLLSGLARGRGVRRIAESLHRLERSGFQPNAWTSRALLPLRDVPGKLEALMEDRKDLDVELRMGHVRVILGRVLSAKTKRTLRLRRRLWHLLKEDLGHEIDRRKFRAQVAQTTAKFRPMSRPRRRTSTAAKKGRHVRDSKDLHRTTVRLRRAPRYDQPQKPIKSRYVRSRTDQAQVHQRKPFKHQELSHKLGL